MSPAIIFIIAATIFFSISLLFSFVIYPKYGFGKRFFHDILGWHEPDMDIGTYYHQNDIHFVNRSAICKFCGQEIMQDSQGNWF